MKKLRSQEWFGRQDREGFMYRSWMKNQGCPHDLFDGRPVIGICNTWSELTPSSEKESKSEAEHPKKPGTVVKVGVADFSTAK